MSIFGGIDLGDGRVSAAWRLHRDHSETVTNLEALGLELVQHATAIASIVPG